MKKILSILCLIIATASVAMADDVTFEARAPKQVIQGKPFQLSYVVNQRSKDLRAPEMPDFDILAGPYTSTSSSTQFINGQRTSSYQQTYTYTLVARNEGTFTIAPASLTVGHQTVQSNGVRITVLPADEEPQQTQQTSSRPSQQAQPQASQTASVGCENIFVKTIVSKTHVHEQECILLQYKLYFAGVDVAQFTGNTKIPDFGGFLKQELEQGEVQLQLEHYNGRNYQTAVLYQTLLYPQKAGEVKIEPAQFEAVLRVQTRQQVRSIFDDFFGTYTNVTKVLNAPGTTIHVDALPAGKPQGYMGGVGTFSINSNITTTELTTNEAVTIRLDITGTGNMKLVKTPSVEWPEGFEVYDPKVSNNFKNSTSGVSGTKSIEYLAIPRAAGDYEIPAIQFAYFDVKEGQYKVLSTPAYHLHVARGAGDAEPSTTVNSYVGKEEIKQLGSDIRYIYTGEIKSKGKSEIPSMWYLWYLIPALIAAVLFAIFRKQIRENADIQRVRYKKANKVAQKRLKAAKKLLTAGDKSAFYEEIERAAWSYLSDRLSIPTAQLGKDNIAQILADKGVEDALIQQVSEVLTTAEFARYAPSQSDHAMQDLYDATAKLIDQLESKKL